MQVNLDSQIMILNIYLEVSINEEIDIKILVIISIRIQKGFSNLQPSHVAEKLNQSEQREVKIRSEEFPGFILAVENPRVLEQLGCWSNSIRSGCCFRSRSSRSTIWILQMLTGIKTQQEVQMYSQGDDLCVRKWELKPSIVQDFDVSSLNSFKAGQQFFEDGVS